MPGRRRGSVRFEAYYKIQAWRDDVGGAWVDLQRAYPTADAAADVATSMLRPGVRYRIMRVAMDGRAPVQEGVAR